MQVNFFFKMRVKILRLVVEFDAHFGLQVGLILLQRSYLHCQTLGHYVFVEIGAPEKRFLSRR